ncbi:MAG: undecaprenyldiphospho-muramoylpentapeptide beta-N-acetylglucosaminyltransferase [Clostridia bacterium]|nr:undecaprenyldiphospho-muramoylpentapeptide beta-N-acetylglucosaminyltransferase [Clostridia bacterium]
MAKTILFTGGGSAGHVTPNLALIERLRKEGYTIQYMGSQDGIERDLIEDLRIPYHAIPCGKLRRYFSWKNFTDPFRVVAGVFAARRIVRQIKPDAVFSKGGFVSVPVVIGAHGRAPIVIHESDYTPGLANRVAGRFADTVCVTFEDTLSSVGAKGVFTGTPIRPALYEGDAKRGLNLAAFDGEKPVLLIMGGSLGAKAVNDTVRAALPRLLRAFDVIHLCGRGKVDDAAACAGYRQYEYVTKELPDLFACADVVLSRAGANAVFELLALCKPALLVPLPRSASRGDQLLNAGYFARKGYAMVLEQEQLTPDTLVDALGDLYHRRLSFISTMSHEEKADGTDEVLAVIRKAAEAPCATCRKHTHDPGDCPKQTR